MMNGENPICPKCGAVISDNSIFHADYDEGYYDTRDGQFYYIEVIETTCQECNSKVAWEYFYKIDHYRFFDEVK